MEPIEFQEACHKVNEHLHIKLGTETIKTEESLGRIISEDVFSNLDNPPFSRSTMDGFAVRSSDTKGASVNSPVVLRLTGESRIGENPASLSAGMSAMRISTGAKIPFGADSVIMVERTTDNGNEVKIFSEAEQGENIAHRGGDLVKGELILKAGTVIDIPHIAVMNALGIETIPVSENLKVGIVSTGTELIRPGAPYTEPKIYDSNGPTIQALLNAFTGIRADYLGTLEDDRGLIDRKLRQYLSDYHILIVSGGSSAGEYDYVYRVISELEPGMLFHGVMIKPGMPTAFGQHGDHFIIGLPGFPVSALMVFFSIFMEPILKLISSDKRYNKIHGKIGIVTRVDSRKTNLIPVKVLGTGNECLVYPVKGLSGSVSRFLDTDGYIVIPPRDTPVPEGETVEIFRFSGMVSTSGKVISGMIDMEVAGWLRDKGIEYTHRRLSPDDAFSAFRNGSVDGVVIEVDEPYLSQLLSGLKNKIKFSCIEISSRPVFSVASGRTGKYNRNISAVTDEFSPWNVISSYGIIEDISRKIKNSLTLRLTYEESFQRLISGEVELVFTTLNPPENMNSKKETTIRKVLLMRE